MNKPSTYVVITYFPTYLPIYETYFLQNWISGWNQILTQLRFIHNWVITGIQWMVHWWVLVHCGPATTLKAFSGQVFTSVEQLLLFDPGNWSGLGPGINNPPARYCLLKPGKQLTHPVLNFKILITYLDDLGMVSIKHVYKRQFRNRKYTYIHIYIYI